MRFLRIASSFLNKFKNSSSNGEELLKKISMFFSGKLMAILGITTIPFLIIIIIFLTLMILFNYKMSLFQLVDPSSGKGSRVGVDLNYDFEDYARLSAAAVESSGNPSADLAPSEFKTVSNFNQHIADSVNQAGYGTRQGVIAAGMAMYGDYIKYTGKRVMYPGTRQDSATLGIADPNYLAMDCSGFVFWALYNGGYNIPSDLAFVQTDKIYEWSNSRGYSRKTNEGKAGDFLVTRGHNHIILIVGVDTDGYWCAEAAGSGIGGVIKKRTFDSISDDTYVAVDMTDYYNDASNVRSA